MIALHRRPADRGNCPGRRRHRPTLYRQHLPPREHQANHDNEDRIIAEVDAAGTTLREYVWLEDIPVAVQDGSTNPTLFWVQADHLNRPVVMYNAAQAVMWKAFYEPFGTVHSITGPAANGNRSPDQLVVAPAVSRAGCGGFQSENPAGEKLLETGI